VKIFIISLRYRCFRQIWIR